MESNYFEGQVVVAIANPLVKLVIRRYVYRIYYCSLLDDPTKEFVYFGREIQPAVDVVSSNTDRPILPS